MFESILRGIESRATLSQPSEMLWDSLGVTPTYTGKSVTTDTAIGMPAVFAAVTLIARTLGALSLPVYKRLDRGRERASGTPYWDLLHDRPNSDMTADGLWEVVTAHLLLSGNAYLEKVKGTRLGIKRAVELWPLVPSTVNVTVDKRGRKVFEVDVNGTKNTFNSDTILHIRGTGFGNGLVGLSPIRNCQQALGIAMAREEYEGRFYANDATPAGILTVDGQLSQEAASRLAESWKANHGGNKKGGTAVLEQGTKFQSLSQSHREQQFAETSESAVAEVARIFNLSPEMIGGQRPSSMTYSTVEGQALHFVKYTLAPWLVRIENSLFNDPDVFPNRAYYPEFLVESLLRADSKARGEFYTALYNIGALNPDEIREKENLPPREGGDEYLVAPPGAAPAQEPETPSP